MTTLGTRLKQLREEAPDRKKSEVAAATGLTRAGYNDLEADKIKSPGAETLLRIAKYHRTTVEYLLEGGDRTSGGGPGAESDLYRVPGWRITAAAGAGLVNYEELQIPGGFTFKRASLERRGMELSRFATMFAGGESMAPTIADRDILLISTGHDRIEDGRIYIIRWGDELRAKRLFKRPEQPGTVLVRSDNSDKVRFPDEKIQADSEAFALIGRVEWRGGWI